MYLLPTDEDIARLYCFIDPETRFLFAAQEAINELTKDSMPYFDEIEDAFNKAKETKGKPTAIIAKTTKGKGVSFMENQVGWHGAAPNDEQYATAMAELNAQLDELTK